MADKLLMILKSAILSVIGVVSWLYFESRKRPSDSSQFIEAMKEAAAVATILAEKVILPQPAVTGMDSEIAEKSVAVCAVVGVATAAAEAVAVALAAA